MLPLLYVSRLDVTEDGKAPFTDWYARRHAPDLLSVGFLSVSSFRAVRGNPEICNLYELRNVEAFGEEYQSIRAGDDEGARLQRNSSNGTLAVYEQVATVGVDNTGGSGPRWRQSITAPVLSTVLFSRPADEQVVSSCHDQMSLSVNRHGALSARLGYQIDAGRPNREPRPWSAFVEWANITDALAWADSGGLFANARVAVDPAPLHHVMRRQFTRANPDGWES